MKIGTKLALVGILSMLVGTAFASPLLVSELEIGEITPFPSPPTGPEAELSIDVIYANFSTQPNSDYDSLLQISYFVVVNVTNNSDDWANLTAVQVDVEVQGYTMPPENPGFSGTAGLGHGWTAKEAWVDNKYYNLTWVPNEKSFWYTDDPELEGYWMEGVQVYEYYENYELVYTNINMNGTWVDVTGRIEVERPVSLPPTKPEKDGTLFSEIKFLRGEGFMHPDIGGLQMPIGSPSGFDELWAPNESRLIVLKDTRSIPARYYEPEKLELLTTQETLFSATANGYLNSSNIYDSQGTAKNAVMLQFEQTEDGYVYSELSENQHFVLDEFDVEAFIETRN